MHCLLLSVSTTYHANSYSRSMSTKQKQSQETLARQVNVAQACHGKGPTHATIDGGKEVLSPRRAWNNPVRHSGQCKVGQGTTFIVHSTCDQVCASHASCNYHQHEASYGKGYRSKTYALSRLQCAMMMNNSVGFHTGHVTTTNNVIADRISRIKHKTQSMLQFKSLIQEYPELAGCKRFRPSVVLISSIMDAILLKKFVDPVAINNELLKNHAQPTS